MKKAFLVLYLPLFLLIQAIVLQTNLVFAQDNGEDYTVMFYNVENLFDTEDDSLKNDGEFTPIGAKNWDESRYARKLKNIYKVIIAIGEWNLPIVVGLSEVENGKVLDDLINLTPLKRFGYQYIHEESGDSRGIDVGLLYRSEYFKYLHHETLKINLKRPTRDILVVTGTIENDTCHFIVNHWPSRMGGKTHTEDLRILASTKMKDAIDSLSRKYCNPKIMALGDFNDGPTDLSIQKIVSQNYQSACGSGFKMINLMDSVDSGSGTLVHTDVFSSWYTFDQIVVSDRFAIGEGISLKDSNARIFKADWLLEAESDRPKRTYLGDFYHGGFSDHLPVYIKLRNSDDKQEPH